MTRPVLPPAETVAIHARGVSTRRTILTALAQAGDATVAELRDASGLGRQLVEQQIDTLARLGCTERAGTRKAAKGRPRNLWRVTDLGRQAIQEPARLVGVRRVIPRATPASRERADQLDRYVRDHAAHVARQRRLGNPEPLIDAGLVSAWGAA